MTPPQDVARSRLRWRLPVAMLAIVALAGWGLSASRHGWTDRTLAAIDHPSGQAAAAADGAGGDPAAGMGARAHPPSPPVADEVALQAFALEVQRDPLLDGARSPRELHAQLQAERRDEAWNAHIHGGIEAAMATTREHFGEAPRTPFVDCRETLCEIHAVSPGVLAETAGDWLDNIRQMRTSGTAGFVDSHTTARHLDDGRILYLTFLVR